MSASRYTFQAAFDGTSNVAAGFEYHIPVVGTHAHSFVQAFSSLNDCSVPHAFITTHSGNKISFQSFKDRVLAIRDVLAKYKTSDGELAAFICLAFVYPSTFLALVDTYNSIQSGVPNFMCVALALHENGFAPLGIRLDSGDLGHLSIKAHAAFSEIAQLYIDRVGDHERTLPNMLSNLSIVASDNLTVPKLLALRKLNHKITAFGIGTHLVTCSEQPAFGGVFKLSSIAHKPRMKFSDDPSKMSTPGEKIAYRIYDQNDKAVCDVLALESEDAPPTERDLVLRAWNQPERRVTLVPHRVRKLHDLVWDGRLCGEQMTVFDSIRTAKNQLAKEAAEFDPKIIGVTCETVEYPVLLTPSLYQMMNDFT
ncbi:Nicotinate phosphoribosyltransferase [Gracilaria domingensis]|nr:Nicotinate phosphoribosyltransferase [Gracilaria domingensis]